MSFQRPRAQALLAALVARAALSLGVRREVLAAAGTGEGPWRGSGGLGGLAAAGAGPWEASQQRAKPGARHAPQKPESLLRREDSDLAPQGRLHGKSSHENGHLHKHKSTFKKVMPLIRIPGNVSRWQHSLNLVDGLGFHKQLGGSFSLMCTLQMDQIAPWQRVFDFSFKADIDSITAGALSNSTHLHFTIFKGKTKKTVKVWNFFEPGKRITALFTVNSTGRMRIWKNGQLAGEIDGHAPFFNDRPHLVIGGHYLYKKQFFHGVVGNVKIWSKEVVWPPAPGTKPINLARQLGGGVSVGGPLPRRKKAPAPPTPAPHAWSRILMDEPEDKVTWDQRENVIVLPVFSTTPPRYHFSDMVDDDGIPMEEGPPLPRPPPQHWN